MPSWMRIFGFSAAPRSAMKRLGTISVGGGAGEVTDEGTPECGARQEGEAGDGAARVLKDGGMESEILGAMADGDQTDVAGHEGKTEKTDHI